MKNILKTFTFWFFAISLLGVVLNVIGVDDINLYIGINPILNACSSNKSARDYINEVPFLWYILSIVTMLSYGLLFDLIKVKVKRCNRK